jgi:TPR repeat protein
MTYVILEDIYKKFDYTMRKEEFDYFRPIESYIINLFNKTILIEDSEDLMKVFWNGVYYYEIDKDHDKAIVCWEKGVIAKYAISALRLGIHYRDNNNCDKGLKYFLMVSTFDTILDMLNISADNKIAYYYLDIEKDLEKAIHFWTRNVNNSFGHHQAGITYSNKYNGDITNVEKFDQGIEWANRAITLGDCDTMHALGNIYYARKAYVKAVNCYKMAVDAGNMKSIVSLAKYFANIENNIIESMKYVTMGANAKNEAITTEIEKMFK